MNYAPKRFSRRTLAVSISAVSLLLWRLVCIFGLLKITGGKEFSDDMDLLRPLIMSPVAFFNGEFANLRQFPPLIGFALMPARLFIEEFGEFIGVRIYLVVLEVVAFLVTMSVLKPPTQVFWVIVVLWAIAPLTVFPATLIVQDEVLSLFVSALLIGALRRRPPIAYLVSSGGFVAAKIFFGLAYLLVCLLDWRRLWFVLTLIGIVTVYGAFLLSFDTVPDDFVPSNAFSTSIWAFAADSKLSAEYQRIMSMGLWLTVFCCAWLFTRQSELRRAPTYVFTIGFWSFLLTFYHVNPEYYLVALPGALWTLKGIADTVLLFVAGSSPWLTNFFYSIAIGTSKGSVFQQVYEAFFGLLMPETCHAVSIVLGLILGLVVLFRMMACQNNSSATAAQPHPPVERGR